MAADLGAPLLLDRQSPPTATVEALVADIALRHGVWRHWWIAFVAGLALLGVFAVAILALLWQGVGIWGNNVPVTWALDIVSYDWWIGVACGAFSVSALLLLLGVEWRGAVNRISETTAIFATISAGLYPILHLGRPWFFYWNLPYPNTMDLWPQFRSPLTWDAVDIISFLLVSLSFWYLGLLPDLAALRDRAFAQSKLAGGHGLLRAQLYGILALGWRGSAFHWSRWTHAYRSIAGFGLMLVISLQSAAAVMFAGTAEPGWHDTLLPISFVLASMLSGCGVVSGLTVILRGVFALQTVVTARQIDWLARLLLGLGIANLYCNALEMLNTALTGDPYDTALWQRRVSGPHAWSFWTVLVCSLIPVQLFWFSGLRTSPSIVGAIGLLVAVGMWADHFMVIVITQQQDFLASAAHSYQLNFWGVATFGGSIGLFLTLMLLFVRYLPVVALTEAVRRG